MNSKWVSGERRGLRRLRMASCAAILVAAGAAAACSSSGPASTSASTARTGGPPPSATQARYEPASVLIPAGNTCSLHPQGVTDPKLAIPLVVDADGVARFYALRPRQPGDVDQMALDCTDVDGSKKTYPVDLRSADTFAPRPFDNARAGLEVRPPLSGDPLRYSTQELIHMGYGLRPDPEANPGGYRQWLRAASMPVRKHPGAVRRRGSGAIATPQPSLSSAPGSLPGAASPTASTMNAGATGGTEYCASPAGTPPGCYWTGATLSGYYEQNSDPTLERGYREVSADFAIPEPIPGAFGVGTTEMSIWTGLDNVFQSIVWVYVTPTAVLPVLFNVQEHDNPSWVAGPAPGTKQGFTPQLNDEVFAENWYCDAEGAPNLGGGYACSDMVDLTIQAESDGAALSAWLCDVAGDPTCPSYQLAPGDVVGTQAEFIVENDGPQDGNTWNWPYFGDITMTNCSATVSQGTTTTTVTPSTDPKVFMAFDPVPAGGLDNAWVSVVAPAEGSPALPPSISWTSAFGPQSVPTPPGCTYTGTATTSNEGELNMNCAGGELVFVFQQVNGAWQYLTQYPGANGATSLVEPQGTSLTLLACSVNASWGLYETNSGQTSADVVEWDVAPVAPGDIGCDPVPTTVQVPVLTCPPGSSISKGICCPSGESNSEGHCCPTGEIWSTTGNYCYKFIVPCPACR